jgi:hypothetical protein
MNYPRSNRNIVACVWFLSYINFPVFEVKVDRELYSKNSRIFCCCFFFKFESLLFYFPERRLNCMHIKDLYSLFWCMTNCWIDMPRILWPVITTGLFQSQHFVDSMIFTLSCVYTNCQGGFTYWLLLYRLLCLLYEIIIVIRIS